MRVGLDTNKTFREVAAALALEGAQSAGTGHHGFAWRRSARIVCIGAPAPEPTPKSLER